MKILVSGASGLIGSALVVKLTEKGHEVLRLVRRASETGGEVSAILWDPETGVDDKQQIEGIDGVVHLAGESIAQRWTDEVKRRIRDSRVHGTKSLSNDLASLKRKPQVMVCASAIGYYGDRGSEELTEESAPDKDFLAIVCQQWEAATFPASNSGVRVVNLRFGVVLSSKGGALAKMIPPFKAGVGGKVGSGRQFMSWVAIDDVVGAIVYSLEQSALSGPVNVVSPNAVTNAEFTRTLGKALSRPTIFPLPAFMVRMIFGEMGEALLLSNQRVKPEKLKASDFDFKYPDLERALRHVIREGK